MRQFDVFNGDADGICSLVQLRLNEPQKSKLVTGIKRDINLLDKVDANKGDKVTVLDISMQKNHSALKRLLADEVEVFYADHHNPGDAIEHASLTAYIDQSASVCTALIIDKFLGGKFHLWAITGAFGDNLTKVGYELANDTGLSPEETNILKELGTFLNYNGYGEVIEDLFFHPADLYQECVKFSSPLNFINDNNRVFETLKQGYANDMAAAGEINPLHESENVSVTLLPNEKWARRVSGVFGNQLSHLAPDRAHAVLTVKKDGNYLVSLRAPKNRPEGADEVASQFISGGGRRAAAGINQLNPSELPHLIALLEQQYGK